MKIKILLILPLLFLFGCGVSGQKGEKKVRANANTRPPCESYETSGERDWCRLEKLMISDSTTRESCKKLETPQSIESCDQLMILRTANENRDIEMCEDLDEVDVRDSCRFEVVNLSNDKTFEICDRFERKDNEVLCADIIYSQEAVKELNLEKCNLIVSDDDLKASCISNVNMLVSQIPEEPQELEEGA